MGKIHSGIGFSLVQFIQLNISAYSTSIVKTRIAHVWLANYLKTRQTKTRCNNIQLVTLINSLALFTVVFKQAQPAFAEPKGLQAQRILQDQG